MTTPAGLEVAERVAWSRQPGIRLAVGAARLLVMLPPHRLYGVLRLLRLGSRPATYAHALRARQSAVAVSARCAGLGCLQRSVAAALICRATGAWPDWCTGFRVEPFAAHAWVEVDGFPVGEPGELSVFRTVLAVRSSISGQAP